MIFFQLMIYFVDSLITNRPRDNIVQWNKRKPAYHVSVQTWYILVVQLRNKRRVIETYIIATR